MQVRGVTVHGGDAVTILDLVGELIVFSHSLSEASLANICTCKCFPGFNSPEQ